MLINDHSSANRLNLQQYSYRTSFTFAKFTAIFKDVGAGIHPSLTLCVFVIELLEEPVGKTQPHTLSAEWKKGITTASPTRLTPL